MEELIRREGERHRQDVKESGKRRKRRRKAVGEKEGEEESDTSILLKDESDVEAKL